MLDLKKDWRDVERSLGITEQQVNTFRFDLLVKQIAADGNLTEADARSLLQDRYAPKDIVAAGKLAKTANKDVRAVLGMRHINQTWGDVAKILGIDWNVIDEER